MRKIIFGVVAGLLLCSTANAKTLEELLVEKGVITKAEASAAAGTTAGTPKVYYSDGTRIEFPDNGFTMQINTYLKGAYTFTDNPDGQKDVSNFDMRNARLVAAGTVLDKQFVYKWEYDAAINKLLDGYMSWLACDWGEVKLGQFKTAISRQYVNNSFKLMFPDGSFASNYFNYGYQKAVKAPAKLFDGEVVAGASIANGNSDGEGPYANSVDGKNMITADLRWNALGKMNAFEESDLNYTKDLALSFGAAYAYSPQTTKIGEEAESMNVNRVNFDANLKYRGLGFNGEYYVSSEDPKYTESWTTQGAYVQAGYFVVPEKFEVAARYSLVTCDDGRGLGLCSGMKNYNRATAGLNYYIYKYNLKAQLAYDYLRSKDIVDETQNTNRYIFQLIGIF